MNHSLSSHIPKFLKLKRENSHFIAYNRLEKKDKNLPEVLFLGGFKSDMMGTKATFLENLCEGRGQAYTRFDYFGHGASSGIFEQGTIGHWLSDTLAMIDEITTGPLILIGSSMGGWLMTLAALARPKRIQALIGIASAPDFTEELIWAALSDAQCKEFVRQGIIQILSQYAAHGIPITLQLIEEARNHLVLHKELEIYCPVHLIHGIADEDVPWALSNRLAHRVKSSEVTLTLIKDGDHRLNTPHALRRLAALLDEVSVKKLHSQTL